MAWFVGEHQRGVDEKGRVIIPSEYRQALGENFIAARGFDKQLSLYPLDEWSQYFNKYVEGDENDPEVRRKRRDISRRANNAKQDSQGRMCIPQELRDYAGITSSVTFIGDSTHVEVWDSEVLKAYDAERTDDFGD